MSDIKKIKEEFLNKLSGKLDFISFISDKFNLLFSLVKNSSLIFLILDMNTDYFLEK